MASKEEEAVQEAEGPSETTEDGEKAATSKDAEADKSTKSKPSQHVYFVSVSTFSALDEQMMTSYVGRTGFRDLGSYTWSLCREFRTTPRWLQNILTVSKINLARRPPPPPKPKIKYPKLRMMED
ncbi:hypothetical protein JOB18_009889 [Solea senegalensis]|uniref:Uncharacterized protein n=1 Tax=Solea senegalensis TaxID=28829 RepID=A0AAV6S3Z2_SOLSE|nr:hypothetical protein JOB18_009009 [Solea senegalensis]KAG7511774.1 hypothetical protein JOB18_009889 [Solea senegalensis]